MEFKRLLISGEAVVLAFDMCSSSDTREHRFSSEQIVAAKSATEPTRAKEIDWSTGTVTRGGGVAATIGELRRTRGPNKNPTKEQIAIRFDRDVLSAFRSSGPGWQTRMNAALEEWLAAKRPKGKTTRSRAAR
jgi:uncharacterized protein (DUF4415 family)